MALTPKQQRFVEEYLIDLNATQAAVRAGYSEKTSEVIGHQLLKKTLVAEAVAQAQAERSERTEVTADNVVRELARIGFEDMGVYAKWGPDGVSLVESSEVDTKPVAEVKETHSKYGSSISFKLHDKVAALEKLGKHLGIFIDRAEIEHKGAVKLVNEDVRAKLAGNA